MYHVCIQSNLNALNQLQEKTSIFERISRTPINNWPKKHDHTLSYILYSKKKKKN